GKVASWSELVLYERGDRGLSRHIIDRLYRDEDGRLVIADYKSGAEPPGGRAKWIEQLRRYRALVDELGAGEVACTLIHHASGDLVIDLSTETSSPGKS
ncbi:MAG: PD-(D/E)XK nuclease family protein, partial [Xanthomonadales bacterium]|nr:PD-(D/E)XK nuclease family protein [Xanthomonadales bacterium]